MTGSIMQPGDLTRSAGFAVAALEPFVDRDWSIRAGDLEWSCRRTLDHIVDALMLYASAVALPVTSREGWIPVRNGDDTASVRQLLESLQRAAAILERVCESVSPTTRVFHPSGLSDRDGFRAMGCSEILTHTDDILLGFGEADAFTPSDDVCERILQRVFPWAPGATTHPDRWQVVKWACGRVALEGHPRLDDRWWWHAAPLDEWDGTRNQRTAPPAWN